jgi:hypothetical protein
MTDITQPVVQTAAQRFNAAMAGAVATAAVSTAGDYLWANVLPHGQPVYWFAHAIVLFTTVGFFLGLPSRQPWAGAAGAVLIGCLATAGFYFLQPLMGYSALFVLFFALWLGLGVLTGRVLQRRGAASEIAVRSLLAAVGSGLGFYAISGIWMPFNPQGLDYVKHFVYWTLAYLPGFGALLLRGAGAQSGGSQTVA